MCKHLEFLEELLTDNEGVIQNISVDTAGSIIAIQCLDTRDTKKLLSVVDKIESHFDLDSDETGLMTSETPWQPQRSEWIYTTEYCDA